MAQKRTGHFFVGAVLLAAKLAVSLTTASVGGTASAQDAVRLATRVDLPPYITRDGSGGIEIDIVKAVFKKAGLTPEFLQMPNPRMVSTFETKRMDGILTRETYLRTEACKTGVYFRHWNVGVTLASRKLKLTSIADLSRYSVLSFVGARKFLAVDFRMAVDRSPHYTEAPFQDTHMDLLYTQRFDVVVGDRWILKHSQHTEYRRTGEFRDIAIHEIMEPLEYVMWFHDRDVCSRVANALLALKQSGEYDAIREGHYRVLRQVPG